MENYNTYTFECKSHFNEFAPDTRMEFVTHREESLSELIYMMIKFATACGYSEKAVKQAMGEVDYE